MVITRISPIAHTNRVFTYIATIQFARSGFIDGLEFNTREQAIAWLEATLGRRLTNA